MFAWSLVLPVLKYTVSLPRLVRLMGCRPGRERDRRVEGQIIRFAWAIYRARPRRNRDNCLERSLLVLRYLSRAGAEPRLRIGARRRDEVLGHAWVVLDDRPLFESVTSLDGFVVLAEFADGRRVSSEAEPPSPADLPMANSSRSRVT
jgi:hypothetical protein